MTNYRGQKRIKKVPLGEVFNPFSPKNVKQENERIRRENARNSRLDAQQVPDARRDYIATESVPMMERVMPGQGPTQYQNEVSKVENAARELQNARVQYRQEMAEQLPEMIRDNAYARRAVNAAETVGHHLRKVPYVPIGIAGTTAVLGGAGLQAYSELSSEYKPTNVGTVAGRAISNLNPFDNAAAAGVVGADPLAAARNNVAAASALVGSEEVLGAIAKEQMMQMTEDEAFVQELVSDGEISRVTRDMVDTRARELMQNPIVFSNGDVRNLRYDEALRFAQEQVHMEMRANNVY
jgi:hypothetical protein